jgi:hypothetical protein
VALFRKKPTLNEQMLRDAGLDRVVFNTPQPGPIDAGPLPPATGDIHVGHGEPRRLTHFDATTTATAPGLNGDLVEFTALPNGDLIVGMGDADDDLSPLADAVEERLSPPYKASGSRQEGDVWEVGASRIEVAEFAFPDADTLQLLRRDDVGEFRIDGGPTDVAPPAELRQLGENAGAEFFVAAQRIDGDYWEVMVNRF